MAEAWAFVSRRRGGIRADWTDWVTYGYLALGVVVMLAPVLWVVLSSFKSEGNLMEFPPTLLPQAAKMDRASPWRVFTRITLPLLKPVLLVVFILAVIRSVQTFDEIYVLTGGGPGTATKMIVHYIFDTGFANMPRNYGLAAAASLMLGAVLFVFTAIQMRLARGAGANG